MARPELRSTVLPVTVFPVEPFSSSMPLPVLSVTVFAVMALADDTVTAL